MWYLRGKRANGDLKDYLTKGQQVFVSGEISQSEYQDSEVKTMYEINANIVDIVGNPSGGKQLKQQAPRQPYQTPRKAYEELERMKTARLQDCKTRDYLDSRDNISLLPLQATNHNFWYSSKFEI